MEQKNPGTRLAALLEARAIKAGEWRLREFAIGADVFAPQSEMPPVCVLKSGLVKLYYLVAEGDQWTKSYIIDAGVFGPTSASAQVTQFGASALEDCAIGQISLAWLGQQLQQDEQLSEALSDFQNWLFERKRKREEDLLCLSAEDRYLNFLNCEPELAERLEQREIASFLRVTPVALSRIRKRLKQDRKIPA